MERKLHTFDAEHFKIDSKTGIFEGYASMFNGLDSYNDTVLPGAYKDTLKSRQRPVSMFFNHAFMRSDMPAKIGKWDSMEEDNYGLKVKGSLTIGHPTADAVLASMKHGTIGGLSIGYRIPEGGAERDGKVRKLKRIDLIEVSVVEDPADLGAVIDRDSIKSALVEMESLAEAETLLRDVGMFSKAAARDFISRLQTVILRDAGEAGTKGLVSEFMQALDSLTLPKSLGTN